MDQVVADHGQRHGEQRECQHDRRRVSPVQGQYGLGRQYLIEGIEADEGYERDAPHQKSAYVPELRPRLNHLRQAELRALRGMKGHEESAERTAQKHRNRHPQQVPAERDADHSRRDGREMRVAGKPYRPKMPHFAVPLANGHVVDRSPFYREAEEFCRHVVLLLGIPPKILTPAHARRDFNGKGAAQSLPLPATWLILPIIVKFLPSNPHSSETSMKPTPTGSPRLSISVFYQDAAGASIGCATPSASKSGSRWRATTAESSTAN